MILNQFLQINIGDIWELLVDQKLDDIITSSHLGSSSISGTITVVQKCTGPGKLQTVYVLSVDEHLL